jgi:hypothetical protein
MVFNATFSFIGRGNGVPGETTDLLQGNDKLYHIMLYKCISIAKKMLIMKCIQLSERKKSQKMLQKIKVMHSSLTVFILCVCCVLNNNNVTMRMYSSIVN